MAVAAPAPPVLDSPRLLLDPLGPAHAARVLAFFERNRAHHRPWDPPRKDGFYTHAYWHDALSRTAQDFLDERTWRFWLLDRAAPDGPVLGMINFSRIVRGPFQCAGIGYSLDEPAVGRGLMHEALVAAIAWAFGDRRLHRLEANYRPENVRSGRLLARLGFEIEGYARRYLLIDDGGAGGPTWVDHVLTSLTRPG